MEKRGIWFIYVNSFFLVFRVEENRLFFLIVIFKEVNGFWNCRVLGFGLDMEGIRGYIL